MTKETNFITLIPVGSFGRLDVEGLVDEPADPVKQDVLVADHVGEDAAEVLGQVLPPRNAVRRLAGGCLPATL